jgi:hypothetical protein
MTCTVSMYLRVRTTRRSTHQCFIAFTGLREGSQLRFKEANLSHTSSHVMVSSPELAQQAGLVVHRCLDSPVEGPFPAPTPGPAPLIVNAPIPPSRVANLAASAGDPGSKISKTRSPPSSFRSISSAACSSTPTTTAQHTQHNTASLEPVLILTKNPIRM